jgi:hypothetical protein
MTRLHDIHGPGFTREQYLSALTAGYETGWRDDPGTPAPWPYAIDDPTSSWADRRPPHRTPTERRRTTLLINKPKDQPIHHPPGLDLDPLVLLPDLTPLPTPRV